MLPVNYILIIHNQLHNTRIETATHQITTPASVTKNDRCLNFMRQQLMMDDCIIYNSFYSHRPLPIDIGYSIVHIAITVSRPLVQMMRSLLI